MSKIAWKDVKGEANRSNTGGRRDEGSIYADIDEGSNYYRVINDDIFACKVYWAWGKYQKSSDPWEATESTCALSKEKDDKGVFFKPRPYYYLEVIERKSGKVKCLRIPKAVATTLNTNYINDKHWGSLTKYDICIVKGDKNSNPLYKVSAVPPTPLSVEDEELVKQSTINLDKVSQPATPEKVKEFIDNHYNPSKNTSSAPQKSSAPQRPSAPVASKKPEPEVSNEFEDSSSSNDEFENL